MGFLDNLVVSLQGGLATLSEVYYPLNFINKNCTFKPPNHYEKEFECIFELSVN